MRVVSKKGMPKHICFVTDEIYPATLGGIGRLLYTTAQELSNAGWQITFLLVTTPETAQAFAQYSQAHLSGVSVYSVEALLTETPPDDRIPLWAFHFLNYHASYEVALALQVLCRRTSFDGIEFNDYRGLGYVSLKWRRLWGEPFEGVPMWVRLHGTAEISLRADDALSYYREQLQLFSMERYCLRHADGWISPSHSTASWYQQVYEEGSIPVVVAPPAFEHLGSGNTHPRIRRQPPYRILFYGKLQYLKGVDIFIRAGIGLCEKTNFPLQFDIVGPEAPHPWNQSYAEQFQRIIPPQWRNHFTFHGYLPTDQLESLAQKCMLAVVPSRAETFCLAAHELNWIGIPLVLNDLPAFRDFFIDKHNCRLFDGTTSDLERVLYEIIGHPDQLINWRWTAPDVITSHRGSDIYGEVLSRFTAFRSNELQTPLVSIIVPYYNMHHYIRDTLNSIHASTYKNWEVIVVDDGSTDVEGQRVFAMLEQQLQGNKQYQFVRKSNGGLGSARNYGLRFARGEYILPLDSDDLIHPHYLELGVQALSRLQELAAVSCFVTYFQDQQPVEQVIDYVIPYDLHPLLIIAENRAGVACSIFRRTVLEAHRYNEQLSAYEDWDLWWQLAEAGVVVEVMPKVLYRYRRRSDSMFAMAATNRHIYHITQIAQNHPHHIRRHADNVFNMYAAMVQELRQENNILRSTPSNKLYFILRRLYRGIRGVEGIVKQRAKQVTRPFTALRRQ